MTGHSILSSERHARDHMKPIRRTKPSLPRRTKPTHGKRRNGVSLSRPSRLWIILRRILRDYHKGPAQPRSSITSPPTASLGKLDSPARNSVILDAIRPSPLDATGERSIVSPNEPGVKLGNSPNDRRAARWGHPASRNGRRAMGGTTGEDGNWNVGQAVQRWDIHPGRL